MQQGPWLRLDPGWAQGAGRWNHVQTSVREHFPVIRGKGESTASIRLPSGLRPPESSELLV